MPRRAREELTTIGGLALVAAFLSFVAAVIFGCVTTTRVGEGAAAEAPNVAAAGAACGFAIAGGLCILAAAVAESGGRRPPGIAKSPLSESKPESGGA